ncbi:MAG: histidine phosphatase family protein [Rickettsiales bacterium]|nr:histidine phosphatase family protein [Rickettsiales bacterium]
MKTIYALRHAKTEIGRIDMDDYDRQLIERGHQNATDLGVFLKNKGWVPDVALVSSAARTRETMDDVNQQFDSTVFVEYTDQLYLAPPGDIFRSINQLNDDHSAVLLVGHNPGIHQFCVDVVKDGESKALRECAMRFPTCAMAVIEADVASWSEIEPDCGYLKSFWDRHLVAAALASAA